MYWFHSNIQASLGEKDRKANRTILEKTISKFSGRPDKEEVMRPEDPRLVLGSEGRDEGLASCVEVVEDRERGRHVVAREEVPPGTLLATGSSDYLFVFGFHVLQVFLQQPS